MATTNTTSRNAMTRMPKMSQLLKYWIAKGSSSEQFQLKNSGKSTVKNMSQVVLSSEKYIYNVQYIPSTAGTNSTGQYTGVCKSTQKPTDIIIYTSGCHAVAHSHEVYPTAHPQLVCHPASLP